MNSPALLSPCKVSGSQPGSLSCDISPSVSLLPFPLAGYKDYKDILPTLKKQYTLGWCLKKWLPSQGSAVLSLDLRFSLVPRDAE